MKQTIITAIFIVLTSINVFAQEPGSGEVRTLSVPDINGRASLLIKPSLPGDVMIGRDGTTVTVKVVVDGDGNVISAKCSLTCPADVSAAAESAAHASKFRPLIVNGAAVKYDGLLMYTIAIERVDWYRFGTALYSTYIFDNLSVAPVAAILTSAFAEEKGQLHNLDNSVDLATRWKTINGVKDSIGWKLKGSDAWWFELGIAMRQATAPFQSDKKLDRAEVQKALTGLSKFADSVPVGVPAESIEALRAISSYNIDPALSNQDLSQAVFKLASRIRLDGRRPKK